MASEDGGPRPVRLARRLTTSDAVVLGLGAMLGAGVFSAFTPAAEAAGAALLLGLVVAGVIAFCNARSSARLAAVYPESGGTYVYGRERLGPFWGYVAGWSFVGGKTASCAAMALTVGHYLWQDHAVVVAVGTVTVITGVNYFGIQRSALLTRVIVIVVVATLGAVAVAALVRQGASLANFAITDDVGFRNVLQAAGFLFFAFAGYARIATLGEEVRNPQHAIPRAITWALAIVLFTYAVTAVVVLGVLGADGVASTLAPISAVATALDVWWLEPVVRIAAVLAAVGALMALVLGVSRTTFAMARDRHLPRYLNAVHPQFGIPHRAELTVGVAVALVVMTVDVRGAIGFSSFLVLVYYGIANAAAFTLDRRAKAVAIPVLGFVGCVVVAFALPLQTVAAGLAVLTAVALAWLLRPPRHRAEEPSM